ncbi:alpha-amylase [Streptomyces sp. NPDC013181]|uniref:Alpha-amylase inhibitor n=1 Tax=Streptomyces nitrosporeus TaxID=28894 RepID=Q53356_9ACTN|nr:proteinaceous alpha-amylase inhibitor [Streptomyces nitrosporeus]prf//1920222A alpha amylase inhibitor T-76 [Streptomyces nitrosporeus]
MTNRMKRISPALTLAATVAAGLMTLAAAPSAAAATGAPAPACVESFQSWRYTDVHNGCSETVSVTVEYTNGQWAPCVTIQPDGWATFAGYGTNSNYVTAVKTCDPAATAS